MATAEERETSTKELMEKQLEDQRKEKDGEISIFKVGSVTRREKENRQASQ